MTQLFFVFTFQHLFNFDFIHHDLVQFLSIINVFEFNSFSSRRLFSFLWAELYAADKGMSEGMGLLSLANDWGLPLGLILELDASATKGIRERRGLGKVPYMAVEALWPQSVFRSGRVKLRRICCLNSTADLGTKPLPWERICGLCVSIGVHIEVLE